jgi:hypothetical protein
MYNSQSAVSPKIVAAAAGAGAGAVVSTLILWIIGVTAYGVPGDAISVSDAVAAVPSPITAAIGLTLTILGAAIPGYQTTDPLRTPSLNPDVVAYQTGSGMVVAGEASPIRTGTPVDVEVNPAVGPPDEDEDLVNVDLEQPADFDDGSRH